MFRILCVLLLVKLVNGVGNQNTPPRISERNVKMKRSQCEKNECFEFTADTNMNCVNKCMSKTCYDEVYAAMPLEDGEIDPSRARLFMSCLRKEYRDNYVQSVKNRRVL